jgi:hypothetical protein
VRRLAHVRPVILDLHLTLRSSVLGLAPQATADEAHKMGGGAHGVWLEGGHAHASRQWSGKQLDAMMGAACGEAPPAAHTATHAHSTRDASRSRCWLRSRVMESMSFLEQARCLRHARLLAGFEGSGFVNSMFMPAGGVIVIIDDMYNRGLFGYQWSFAQYVHAHLIFLAFPGRQQRTPEPQKPSDHITGRPLSLLTKRAAVAVVVVHRHNHCVSRGASRPRAQNCVGR